MSRLGSTRASLLAFFPCLLIIVLGVLVWSYDDRFLVTLANNVLLEIRLGLFFIKLHDLEFVDLLHESIKGLLDTNAELGRAFHEAEVVFHSIFRSHVVRDLAVLFVLLVAKEHNDDFVVSSLQNVLIPAIDCLETFNRADIINEESSDGSSEEQRSQRLKLLLAKCIPDVEARPFLCLRNVDLLV